MIYYKITCRTPEKKRSWSYTKDTIWKLYEKQCLSRSLLRLGSSEHSTFAHLLRIERLFLCSWLPQKSFFQGWNFLPSSTALKVACPDDPSRHLSPNQSPSTRAAMAINGTLVSPGFAWEIHFSNLPRTQNSFCLPKIWLWIEASKGNVTVWET